MVVSRRIVRGDGGRVEAQPPAEAEHEGLRHGIEAEGEQQGLEVTERAAGCVVVREGEEHGGRHARQLAVQDVRLELLQEAPVRGGGAAEPGQG